MKNININKNNLIPIVFNDMDLNKHFLKNLILNKECNHIQGLLKIHQRGFLYNEPFAFHHYNIKSTSPSCFFYSDVINLFFPDKKQNVFVENNLIESFEYKINHKSSNGYSFFFIKDKVYIFLNYFKEDDLIRNKIDSFSNYFKRDKNIDYSIILVKIYLVNENNQLKLSELSLNDFEDLIYFINFHNLETLEDLYLRNEKEIKQQHEREVFCKIKENLNNLDNNDNLKNEILELENIDKKILKPLKSLTSSNSSKLSSFSQENDLKKIHDIHHDIKEDEDEDDFIIKSMLFISFIYIVFLIFN